MSDDRTIPVPEELLKRLHDYAGLAGVVAGMGSGWNDFRLGAFADRSAAAALLVQPVTEEPASRIVCPVCHRPVRHHAIEARIRPHRAPAPVDRLDGPLCRGTGQPVPSLGDTETSNG